MKHVVLSGSRTLTEYDCKWPLLNVFVAVAMSLPQNEIIRWHVGDCPTGLDHLARSILRELWDVQCELHVANWATYGSYAGPLRNHDMLELTHAHEGMFANMPTGFPITSRADLVLAWPKGLSKGTRNAMKQAFEMYIPVVNMMDDSVRKCGILATCKQVWNGTVTDVSAE